MQFFRKEKFEHSPLGLWDFKNVDCHFRYFTFMMQTLKKYINLIYKIINISIQFLFDQRKLLTASRVVKRVLACLHRGSLETALTSSFKGKMSCPIQLTCGTSHL